MAKCATCGENIPDNSAFCTKCGSPLAENKMASDLALENAKKEFEKDSKISINRGKITFVCELCGAINRIDNAACTKCGKPRPRGEFVSALKRIQDGSILAEQEAAEKAQKEAELKAAAEVAEKQQREAEVIVSNAEQPVVQAPLAEEKPLSLFRFESSPSQQTKPISQPFVIVPYVDTNQQLWQYQPKQVYKFQPFTLAEKDARAQKQSEIASGTPTTAEELIRLRNAKQEEIKSIDNNLRGMATSEEKVIVYSKKSKSIIIYAIISIICAIAMLVATFALPVIQSAGAYKGLEVFKSLGNCITGAFNTDLGFATTAIQYSDWSSWIIPIAYILISVFAVIIAIHNVIKLVTGRARVKGIVLPAISLVLTVLVAIAVMNLTNRFDAVLDGIKDTGFGVFVAMAASLLLLIISCIAPKNTKVNKK